MIKIWLDNGWGPHPTIRKFSNIRRKIRISEEKSEYQKEKKPEATDSVAESVVKSQNKQQQIERDSSFEQIVCDIIHLIRYRNI